MATITTDTDFQNALSYLTKEGQLPAGIQVNSALRLVRDNNGVDITPDTATLETALDGFVAWSQEADKEDTVKTITRDDAIIALRNALASDSLDLSILYTRAKSYVDSNAMLTNTMDNLRTIHETATGVPIVLSTNQGKAIYITLFRQALALWS